MYVFISSPSIMTATHHLMYARRVSQFRLSTWKVECQPADSYTNWAIYPLEYINTRQRAVLKRVSLTNTKLRIGLIVSITIVSLPPIDTYRKLYSNVYRSIVQNFGITIESTNQQHCIHAQASVLLHAQATSTNQQHCIHVSNMFLICYICSCYCFLCVSCCWQGKQNVASGSV